MSYTTPSSTKFLLRFFVPGIAIPKQSFKIGAGGQGYTSDQVQAWEDSIRTLTRNAMRLNEQELTTLPVRVTLEFILPDRRRKDIDNLTKAIFDGLKGEAIKDDDQVIELVARKVYKDQLPKDDETPIGVTIYLHEG